MECTSDPLGIRRRDLPGRFDSEAGRWPVDLPVSNVSTAASGSGRVDATVRPETIRVATSIPAVTVSVTGTSSTDPIITARKSNPAA